MYCTSCTSNLGINGRLETGWKFLKSSVFNLVFFNNGIIKAVLTDVGIKASSKERFTISVITGSNLGKHLASTEAGSGSKAQVLALEDLIKLAMRSVETRIGHSEYQYCEQVD